MTAIGVVETLSIPLGVLAGDQMVKTAQVDLVTAQTVCAGKYIVVVSGEVAAVRSSVSAGIENAGSTLVDSLVIPNVDERVVAAMAGACPAEQVEAVGVVETFSLASAISVADIRQGCRRGPHRGAPGARHGRQILCDHHRRGRRCGSVGPGRGGGRRAGGPDRLQRGDSLSPYGHDSRADVRLLLGAGT